MFQRSAPSRVGHKDIATSRYFGQADVSGWKRLETLLPETLKHGRRNTWQISIMIDIMGCWFRFFDPGIPAMPLTTISDIQGETQPKLN